MQVNRRKFTQLLLATTALTAVPAFAQSRNRATRWGTSVLGAGSQVALAGLIGVVSEASPELGVQEQITGGPVENMRLLSQGELEIAQTTTNAAYEAYLGQGGFEGSQVPMLGLFALYPANCTLAALASSDITTIEDLRGKRIAIGPPAAGITVIIEAWLEAYGIAEDATLVRIGYAEGADQLRSGGVDAALIYGVGVSPAGFLQELDVATDLRVLGWDVDNDLYNALKEAHPELAVYGTFSKDLVEGLETDLIVPTTYSLEYSATSYPEEDGYQLVRAVWENRQAIADRAALGRWLGIAPENMLLGLLPEIPVHPGAARFYQEQGVWDDAYTIGESAEPSGCRAPYTSTGVAPLAPQPQPCRWTI
jgi:TRAP transporter solute receptor, TAXI family